MDGQDTELIKIHQSPVPSHQSPVTSPQSPVTSHQLPVTIPQSPFPSHLYAKCMKIIFNSSARVKGLVK